MSRVLLCARGGAPEIPAIVRALRDRDAEVVVLDSSAFPDGAPLSLSYGRGDLCACWAGVATDDITAVWQCLVVGATLPTMAPGMRETCVAAAELAVVGLLDSLHVFQLDPFAAKARADNKPHQLRVAQRLGLDIPETLISNDPDAVRAFARRHGALVMKMLAQPASTGPATDEADVMFTTAMSPADLEHLDGLDLCPMIFQERIPNQRDVRVTIVGHRIFAAALDASARRDDAGEGDADERIHDERIHDERIAGPSSATPSSATPGSAPAPSSALAPSSAPAPVDLDWRRESYALDRAPTWAPYQLPAELTARLFALLDHFGLNYGAADFVVRPDGHHVFLELNASGAFAFLGPELTRAIADAIADTLLDPAARRIPHV